MSAVNRCDDDPETQCLIVRAVPASVSRRKLTELFAGLGIDLADVNGDDGITIGRDSIRCRVMARGDDGHPYLDETGERMATHDVCIQVEDR